VKDVIATLAFETKIRKCRRRQTLRSDQTPSAPIGVTIGDRSCFPLWYGTCVASRVRATRERFSSGSSSRQRIPALRRARRTTLVRTRVSIPIHVLKQMQRDGVLLPGVMIVGSAEQSLAVDCTAAMAAWCETKADAAPGEADYRIIAGEIRKSLNASRILTCRYGHRHPPEQVWVNTGRPDKPRPYHCAECSERKKGGNRPDGWTAFNSPAVTGRRPCRVCFPSD
jgi:hypothetical protein